MTEAARAAVAAPWPPRYTWSYSTDLKDKRTTNSSYFTFNSRFLSSVVLDGQFTHMEVGDYWWAEKEGNEWW